MPDFEIEDSLNCMVAGVDEAGRGPWAGPVVAGAVIIRDRNLGDELLKGLDDSKKLSAKKRELLYEKLREEEKNGRLFIGIGQASAEEIDRCNILQATFAAMKRAVEALKEKPEFAIIDGNQTPKVFVSSTYSQTRLYSENDYPVTPSDQYRYGQYLVANIFWNVNANLQVGAEYLRGWRTDFNDMTRHANRLNVSAQYNF